MFRTGQVANFTQDISDLFRAVIGSTVLQQSIKLVFHLCQREGGEVGLQQRPTRARLELDRHQPTHAVALSELTDRVGVVA